MNIQSKISVRTLAKISMLSVMAFILMFFDFRVPFAPSFMKVDISDLPSLIGGFALGPVPGILIVFLKNLLNIIFESSDTAYVGELSNFIVGSVFVSTAAMIYRNKKTFKRAIIALIVGVFAMTIFATGSNYFVVFPLYARVFGLPIEQMVSMGSAVNGLVTDYKTLMIFAVMPFNLLKGLIVSFVTLLIYKRVSPILKR